MTARLYTVHADGISLTLDLEVGHIRSLEIDYSGRRLHPFHTAALLDYFLVARSRFEQAQLGL